MCSAPRSRRRRQSCRQTTGQPPGRRETLISEARIVRAGNRVAVVSLTAFHPGAKDAPVATGTAVYNIRRARDA